MLVGCSCVGSVHRGIAPWVPLLWFEWPLQRRAGAFLVNRPARRPLLCEIFVSACLYFSNPTNPPPLVLCLSFCMRLPLSLLTSRASVPYGFCWPGLSCPSGPAFIVLVTGVTR